MVENHKHFQVITDCVIVWIGLDSSIISYFLMCDNIFTSSSDCTTYLWRHTGDRPFLWKYNLKINSRKYTEEKAFPRIQRDQDFMQNSSFMVSDIWEIAIVIRLFHRNINFRYTQGCTLGKSHTYAAIWTTLGKKHYKGSNCNKAFKGKGYLLIHMRTHASEKLYSNSNWNKFVFIFGNLILHRKIHSGERPYLCK